MGKSHKMMGKSNSLEDLSAVQRMASGKRWCASWVNVDVCRACGEGRRSESHILRTCGKETMIEERRKWTGDISKRIGKIRDRDLKGVVEEMWTRMRYRRGGEMAMMGCFQLRWVETIHKGRMELKDGEIRIVMNIMREIGHGARNLVKMYRDHVGKDIGSKDLRQTNIRGFYGNRKRKLEVKESVVRGERKKIKLGLIFLINY